MTRTCAVCNEVIVRRRYERPSAYAKRVYCSSVRCRGIGHQRKAFSADGPPWVEAPSGCWIWTHRHSSQGYGVLSHRAYPEFAHRWVYEREIGALPRGVELDHLCRNRACVNPAHLEPVRHDVNVQRGDAAKVLPEQIIAIRDRYKGRGNPPQWKLAEEFGLTQQHVSAILQELHWTDNEERRRPPNPARPRGDGMRITKPTRRVLQVLLEEEKSYGFDLTQKACLGPGSVYPILHRLLERDWVEDWWEDIPGRGPDYPRRRFYRLTPAGRSIAEEWISHAV